MQCGTTLLVNAQRWPIIIILIFFALDAGIYNTRQFMGKGLTVLERPRGGRVQSVEGSDTSGIFWFLYCMASSRTPAAL